MVRQINFREKVDKVKPEWEGNYKLMWVDKEGDQVGNFLPHALPALLGYDSL